MNTEIFKKAVLVIILFFCADAISMAEGMGDSTDDFVAGKIEFIGQNGREGIVVLNSPGKEYLLGKGVLLAIKRENSRVALKVNDAAGKYLRCAINSEKDTAVIKHGEDVYYIESMNSGIKYRDAKKMLAGLIKLYENFILKIEATEDPRIISESVQNFSSNLDRLIPEMKRINSRYPELATSRPEEIHDESAMLEVLEPRLKEAFFKIKIYSSDENVKKAAENLQKVLIKLNTGR